MKLFDARSVWSVFGSLSLALSACGLPPDGEELGTRESAIAYADVKQIDFSGRPSYLPSNTLVLTFDDGPDWTNTPQVLSVLRQKGVKASFFINTENWSNVSAEPAMQQLLRDLVAEGHELASHSVHHYDLSTLNDAQLDAELTGVENTVRAAFGGGGPRMTLFRAPFGVPFQGMDLNNPNTNRVVEKVNSKAVHIGWAIDAFDYNCAGSADCVFNNFKAGLDAGNYGVVLLHSVHAQTAGALGRMIDHARSRGFQFKLTEDVVRARYGRSSAELISGGPVNPGGPVDNGVYPFRSVHSNLVMDVAEWSTASGGVIHQWAQGPSQNNQLWTTRAMGDGTWSLVSRHSGKCLDLPNGTTANGVQLIQWDCWGGPMQRWRLERQGDGSFVIRSVASNKCVDVDGWGTQNGARIHQWDCHGGGNQRWRLQ